MSMKQEIAAWRKAFPDRLYSKTADTIMEKAKPAVYACHVEGYPIEDCVFDTEYQGQPCDCCVAVSLMSEGKGKEHCGEWRPITIVKPKRKSNRRTGPR